MIAPALPLASRTVLVTGASSGIGAATALALAAGGATVCAGARRTDRLLELSQQAHDLPGRVVPHQLDVTDAEALRGAVLRCTEELGGLSGVVANAGVTGGGDVTEADLDAWRTLLDVDVLGLMSTVAVALPALREAAGGEAGVADVVLVGSASGRRVASPRSPAYAAAKHAVTGFAESLRQEVHGSGVRVTLVEPGFVATEATASKEWGDLEPLQADDVAGLVAHVLGLPPRVQVSEFLVRPTGQAT